ncbi:hypothetical protein BDV33DRAFT_209979 [Aspergillus novoparasiticus]|uniref:Uncharacterized protein n=1 Tax=Aspergillus novoparasiticus TaxID=986946 RepID=A0A5N6EA75_9EURO|nr:hypothetical protein BDV33DRAFT_209979 [Aspergillus novoparasiticus]
MPWDQLIASTFTSCHKNNNNGPASLLPRPGTQLQVIGAGLSRTGTASFSAALKILLDGPIYHEGTQTTMEPPVEIKSWNQILRAWLAGDSATTLSLLRRRTTGYAAITDAPASQFVPELLTLYPRQQGHRHSLRPGGLGQEHAANQLAG